MWGQGNSGQPAAQRKGQRRERQIIIRCSISVKIWPVCLGYHCCYRSQSTSQRLPRFLKYHLQRLSRSLFLSFHLSFQLLPYLRMQVYDLKMWWKKMAGLFCTVASLRRLSANDDIIKAAPPQSVAKPNRRIDVANNQRPNRSCIFLFICSMCLWSSNEWYWANADIHYSQHNMKNIPRFWVLVLGLIQNFNQMNSMKLWLIRINWIHQYLLRKR